jgi:transglutaminase-like putative cysteine protease
MSTLPAPSLYLLFAGIALAAGPHVQRLPTWVAALAAALLAWRTWAALRGEPLPRKSLVLALAFAALCAVFAQYRTLFGRDAGVALLVVFLALKLLEMRSRRDVTVVTFLCYFLALTNFFYTQSIGTALATAGTLLVLTASLVGFNAPRRSVPDNLRTAGALLAQGLPVMLALFLLFPRVNGPLWGLPQDAYEGMTGLSDTMTPGTISQLSQSDAIAFRVRFEGEPPTRGQMYWRGPVFWDFDGRTWRAGRLAAAQSLALDPLSVASRYEVTLEPHNRTWLFALDVAAASPPDAFLTDDYQALARAPVRARMRYAMSSFVDYQARAASTPGDLAYATRLPPEGNPRARALAERWRRETGDAPGSDAAILDRAIRFFRDQDFAYTLQPPLAGEDAIDQFLFVSRRGFCEHFSGAFTMLMRAAGLPARVVTGYQGGELNPVDNFITVRQADAHAWSEVWIEGRGWLRVDPTAVVSPVRVESGVTAALPADERVPLLARPGFSWLRDARFQWEALANRWNQWVLGYNPERQRDLLSRLGMPSPDWQKMATALIWVVGACLALFALVLLARRTRPDPVQLAWTRFCAKLARAGTPRAPTEGPEAFAARAGQAHPERAARVTAIAGLYADLRYGPGRDASGVTRLRRLVREFKV